MKIKRVQESVSLRRSIDQGTEEQRIAVLQVIQAVKRNGDKALYEYTEKWDGAKLSTLKVTKEEIKEAYEQISPQIINIIQEAAEKYPQLSREAGETILVIHKT